MNKCEILTWNSLFAHLIVKGISVQTCAINSHVEDGMS